MDIAAAKIAAIIRPETPEGNWSTMNIGKIRSTCSGSCASGKYW